MYVLTIGASKRIGYLASLRLLAAGNTITFLLRNPSVFDEDSEMQSYIQRGLARLVKGNATSRPDVQRALHEARIDGQLDAILFSVGGAVTFSITKGFVLDQPSLCSSAFYNLLVSIPEETTTSPQPKLIAISAFGITRAGHDKVPLILKPLYNHVLRGAHVDKLVMERVAFHAAGLTWPEDNPTKLDDFLGPDWQKDMKDPGYYKELVIIRPTLLTDGDDKPATGKYKASIEEFKNAYSIPRKEVAHFMVEGVLKNWEEWKGRVVNITQ